MNEEFSDEAVDFCTDLMYIHQEDSRYDLGWYTSLMKLCADKLGNELVIVEIK